MFNISNTPLKLIGETSFKHYGCVITASLYVDNAVSPLHVVIVPHSNQDELGEQITFAKISRQWLTEYSLPVLHCDTYKNIVENILEFLTK